MTLIERARKACGCCHCSPPGFVVAVDGHYKCQTCLGALTDCRCTAILAFGREVRRECADVCDECREVIEQLP